MTNQDEERELVSHLDEGDEEGEDERPEPPEEQRNPPPPPPAETAAAQPPKGRKSRKGIGGRPKGAIGQNPEQSKKPAQADELWPDVIDRITKEGRTPYDLFIRVYRYGVGGYGVGGIGGSDPMQRQQTLGTIEGGMVCGGEGGGSPSELLRDAVIDLFHEPATQMGTVMGPATYKLEFVWNRGGTVYDVGTISLPAMREVAAFRYRAQQFRQQGGRPGMGAVPDAYPPPQSGSRPSGQPPMQPPPQQAPPQAPPWQQGPYANPQYPQQQDPTTTRVLTLLDRLDERMTRMEDERRAPPPGHVPPPPPIVPPPPQRTIKDVLAEAQAALDPLGVKLTIQGAGGAPIGIGAAPAQTPAAPPAKPKTQAELIREFLKEDEDRDALRRDLAASMGIDLDAPEPEPETKKEEKKDDDGLGYTVQQVPGAKWPDGSPVQQARDEKGGIHGFGTVMSNPYFMEKGATVGIAIVGAIAQKVAPEIMKAIQADAEAAAAEEKKEIPDAETDKNGAAAKAEWDQKL
jgi:hypothetical protein